MQGVVDCIGFHGNPWWLWHTTLWYCCHSKLKYTVIEQTISVVNFFSDFAMVHRALPNVLLRNVNKKPNFPLAYANVCVCVCGEGGGGVIPNFRKSHVHCIIES